jgi:hypothetical protein
MSGRRPKVEVVLPDATDLITDPRDLSALQELVDQHVHYSAMERSAKAMKEPVVQSLKSIGEDYGLTKLTCNQNKVTRYKVRRSTIVKQLLLDAGVSHAIIKACTVDTDSWAIRVTPPGADDAEEDDSQSD